MKSKTAKKRFMEIKIDPDPALRSPNVEVTKFDKDLFTLAQDMIYTMNRVRGVGLAAPQVGVNISFAVVSVNRQPIVICNPSVVNVSDELIEVQEACLSCPGKIVKINRPFWIELKYNDIKGREHFKKLEGINSVIASHEIDHLNRVLITDYEKTE